MEANNITVPVNKLVPAIVDLADFKAAFRIINRDSACSIRAWVNGVPGSEDTGLTHLINMILGKRRNLVWNVAPSCNTRRTKVYAIRHHRFLRSSFSLV